MRHSDSRTLINLGRKAGLSTAELYLAIATRPSEAGDTPVGETDGNGFVTEVGRHGERVYRPTAQNRQ